MIILWFVDRAPRWWGHVGYRLHLSARFIFVLKACPTDQWGSVRRRPIPNAVVRASCIVAAECRVVFRREVAFGHGRSYSMLRLCSCESRWLLARSISAFPWGLRPTLSFFHSKFYITTSPHSPSLTLAKALWFIGFENWVSFWGCWGEIYHLLFSSIPPILSISHFRPASLPAILKLGPSLWLLQFCPLCDDVSRSLFIDLSPNILLIPIRSLFAVLAKTWAISAIF